MDQTLRVEDTCVIVGGSVSTKGKNRLIFGLILNYIKKICILRSFTLNVTDWFQVSSPTLVCHLISSGYNLFLE